MDGIAFHLGKFPVHWYGVLVALGFWAGLGNASRRARRQGMSVDVIWDVGLWLIVGTIIGARTLHVVTFWETHYAGKPLTEIFMIHHGGLVYYGGLIGAIIAGLAFFRIRKLPVWKFGDVLAPGIALGSVFGRLGCFMNGCCYGRETACAWAVHFPAHHETAGHGVHPTQVYDSLLNLALFFFLSWLYPRRRFDGQVFAAYLLGYAVLRSVVEFFRGDYPQYYGGWATQAHLISVGILVVGLVLYWQLRTAAGAKGHK